MCPATYANRWQHTPPMANHRAAWPLCSKRQILGVYALLLPSMQTTHPPR